MCTQGPINRDESLTNKSDLQSLNSGPSTLIGVWPFARVIWGREVTEEEFRSAINNPTAGNTNYREALIKAEDYLNSINLQGELGRLWCEETITSFKGSANQSFDPNEGRPTYGIEGTAMDYLGFYFNSLHSIGVKNYRVINENQKDVASRIEKARLDNEFRNKINKDPAFLDSIVQDRLKFVLESFPTYAKSLLELFNSEASSGLSVDEKAFLVKEWGRYLDPNNNDLLLLRRYWQKHNGDTKTIDILLSDFSTNVTKAIQDINENERIRDPRIGEDTLKEKFALYELGKPQDVLDWAQKQKESIERLLNDRTGGDWKSYWNSLNVPDLDDSTNRDELLSIYDQLGQDAQAKKGVTFSIGFANEFDSINYPLGVYRFVQENVLSIGIPDPNIKDFETKTRLDQVRFVCYHIPTFASHEIKMHSQQFQNRRQVVPEYLTEGYFPSQLGIEGLAVDSEMRDLEYGTLPEQIRNYWTLLGIDDPDKLYSIVTLKSRLQRYMRLITILQFHMNKKADLQVARSNAITSYAEALGISEQLANLDIRKSLNNPFSQIQYSLGASQVSYVYNEYLNVKGITKPTYADYEAFVEFYLLLTKAHMSPFRFAKLLKLSPVPSDMLMDDELVQFLTANN